MVVSAKKRRLASRCCEHPAPVRPHTAQKYRTRGSVSFHRFFICPPVNCQLTSGHGSLTDKKGKEEEATVSVILML